jgi:glycosyltransferase involved in cell wall biosynthesis
MSVITIFIPTYRRPQLLKRAIESALSQTWKNIQVIICDNASGDQTKDIVAEFIERDSRVQYICHPLNIGMLANYQFALSILDTAFFSFLSDDDLLLPHFCHTAMEGFQKYPDIGFFAASTVIISEKNGVLSVPLQCWPREGRFTPKEGLPEMIGKFPPPTTVVFRKKAAIDFENQIGWDCDFLIQLAAQAPFAISKSVCGVMVNHPESFTSEQGYEKFLDSMCKLIIRVQNFSWMDGSLRHLTLKAMNLHLEHVAFTFILSHLAEERLDLARNIVKDRLRKGPFGSFSFFSLFNISRNEEFPFAD